MVRGGGRRWKNSNLQNKKELVLNRARQGTIKIHMVSEELHLVLILSKDYNIMTSEKLIKRNLALRSKYQLKYTEISSLDGTSKYTQIKLNKNKTNMNNAVMHQKQFIRSKMI